MKGTTLLKLLLDIAMCTIYIILMFEKETSSFFHEAAGIGIGILFIIHLILNRGMAKGLISEIGKGSAKANRQLLLASDIIVCIGMPIVIVTGILIAKELFFINSGLSRRTIFTLHYVMSYVCLGTLILHVVLHGKYLAGVCSKISSIDNKELKSALCRFGAGAAAMVTLYSVMYVCLRKEKDCALQSHDKKNNKVTQPFSEQNQTDINAPLENNASFEATDYGKTENDERDKQTFTDPAAEDIPTLEEYLGNLHCTGCHRNCSLLNPRCGKGRAQADQAQEKYSQIYSS